MAVLAGLVLLLPWGNRQDDDRVGPLERLDEREIVFYRFYRLKPGMAQLHKLYEERPDLEAVDQEIRALPGLLGTAAESYDAATTPMNVATFDVMERLYKEIDWPAQGLENAPIQDAPEAWTRRIKGYARALGADLVGIAPLEPAAVYSHIGRSPGAIGEPITLNHPHAIVLAVSMDSVMIAQSPHHAATTESSLCYLKAGQAALVLSRYIQRLGHAARAHVDGNYRVLCGPLAVAAGLGELGRLGLIITPQYGPRVRFAVVTTDLPLVHDRPIHFGVQDFCRICKKCAQNCPSGAIARGEKEVVRGLRKWRSSQEACFRYWNRVGSDCALCIKVCPYAHPNTPVHQVIRWALPRNPLVRRLALWGDDFFYGRRPKGGPPLPGWHASHQESTSS